MGANRLRSRLTIFGWILWTCDGATRRPLLLFCLAALTRETSLIVPVALAFTTSGSLRRRAAALTLPAGTYGLWTLIVRWRTGLFPGNAGGGRVRPFFGGLVSEIGGWTIAEWVTLALILGLGLLAWRLDLEGAKPVLVLHAVAATTLGPLVWQQAFDFGRVFVIIEWLGVMSLLPRREASTTSTKLARHGAG